MSLSFIIGLILQYRYPLIFLLTIVEGPIIMMLAGFYVSMNAFDLVPIYFTLMAGDLVGDVGWYCIGYFWGRPFVQKFGWFFSITDKNIATIDKFFHKYHNSILIISKLTMGFGFAVVTLFTAGLTRVPFKRYFALNFLGQFIWTALLMAVGYFLGNLYVNVNNVFARITIIAGFVIVFLLLLGVGKFIKSKITERD